MKPRILKVLFATLLPLGAAMGAGLPEGPRQFREFRASGKTGELARVFEEVDALSTRPLEAWMVGEALIVERRGGDALQLAEALSRNAPASYAGAYLRFQEAQSRGDTAGSREIAREVVLRPYEPPRLGRPEAKPGLSTRFSGPVARVEFENKGAEPVRVSWVDSQGKLVDFGTLGRGEKRTQVTYEGHVWDVAGVGGESIRRVEAGEGTTRVEVGARSKQGKTGGEEVPAEGGSRGRRLPVSSWYRQPVDLVLMGRLRLAGGSDPKSVMEACYERALREDPESEEAMEAVVELALEKHDGELAARRAREGLKRFGHNAHLHALLGVALGEVSLGEARAAFERALELDSRERVASRALAEFAFSREDRRVFEKCLENLPAWEGEGAALRLADSLLSSDGPRALELRKPHARNAFVLHRAGVLLSSRYRFKEGAELQKAALAVDPGFREARRALAEDLLRTGHSEEAWPLVEQVQNEDGYDVTAYNLLELRDRVANFTRIQSAHFNIWMEPVEASVYGDRVKALLERAHATLTAKYAARLPQTTTVEIFAKQSDFAVRTFGVPGGDGFLGVCFGPVITAPSPASPRASGHSWEATLWHEFAHTVTLTLTHNRMPRWLSEGISVHEEQQANPGWGQRFRPRHAGRLLGGKLTPLEEMDSAFRASGMQEIDFAYFQAGLIVDWLVARSGMAALRGLLEDLGKGQPVNSALVKRYGPFEKLNAEFAKFAENWVRTQAGSLKWKADETPKVAAPPATKEAVELTTVEELMAAASKALRQKDWEGARRGLEKVVEAAPKIRDPEGAYAMLARVYRQLGMEAEEVTVLEKGLGVLADFPGVHERLLELYEKQNAWPQVERICGLGLGIAPMSLRLAEGLVRAAEAGGRTREAVDACRKALVLDPNRASRWHSRLGRLLCSVDPEEARSHLLEALENNPRDRAALEALALVQSKRGEAGDAPSKAETAPAPGSRPGEERR